MVIRLQFSRQPDPISSLIAWFSQGEFSHVDAITSDGYLLGARSDWSPVPGVRIRPSDYAKFAERKIFTIPATDEQTQKFWEFLTRQVGKPYDKWSIWGFLDTTRDWRSPDSWICSELQAAALEYARIVPPLFLAVNKITPVSLALTVSAIKGTTYKDA